MPRLASIDLSGFKSIGLSQHLELNEITILLGANGAGKSNLISFLKLLNSLVSDGLQYFVAKNGMADAICHFGAKTTQVIPFQITLSDADKLYAYQAELAYGIPNTLFFSKEMIHVLSHGKSILDQRVISQNPRESVLLDEPLGKTPLDIALTTIRNILKKCQIYQFHDTSESSRLRNGCYIEDNYGLKQDAGNLPAFLYAMRTHRPNYYRRILEHIRAIIPQFVDFHLEPSANDSTSILLNCIGERGHDYLLGPHQLSDGSLRYIALTTLLLQPQEALPDIIVLDEPELGLHPAAIVSLAEMVNLASQHCQIMLATQSAALVNQFQPQQIAVIEYNRQKGETEFSRLNRDSINLWLHDYSLGELWDKNVLGGRP